MTIITRFPPSPTGLMHIGTARTALYNWLFARRHGGKMLFRIEDTDRARYDTAHVDAIINGMKWLELDWDGPVVSQFEQRNRHADVAHELLKRGEAYYCYCSPDELEEMRQKAMAEGRPTFYDRRWRHRSAADAPKDIKPVIRIKAPLPGGTMTVADKVQGDVSVAHEQLDDFIILRSDGTPTYMLSVVVDDHDMGVTHVIRGDDHLNNTFRQNIIYNAMGWTQPVYAHLPLILGPDGAKMSKRHGAASVEEYAKMGYLPEAMRNYLLRLGWSHGDDEIISTEQAIAWFNLEHIGQSAARFDFAKLENLNAHYIKQCDPQRLINLTRPFYANVPHVTLNDEGLARVRQGIDELKSRSKTLIEFAFESAFYLKSAPIDLDAKAQEILQKADPAILKRLQDDLTTLPEFTAASIEDICKKIAQDLADGKLGMVAMPMRAALTGRAASPSIFPAAAILGREEVLRRLRKT
ncbi:MAG: glutamate--tRNA ligase [Alphaproteobacteria bacterium]|nr:glutamate--tRNA ligase [Alphaproteobacteria bacterium]